jgi:hypothetical protein
MRVFGRFEGARSQDMARWAMSEGRWCEADFMWGNDIMVGRAFDRWV